MLKCIPSGPLEVNCYILSDDATGEAFIIDPGGDAPRIRNEVEADGLKVLYIVNTHGHFDHVGADGELKEAFGVPVAIHSQDAGLLVDAHDHAVIFGVRTSPQPAPDILLEDGSTLSAGGVTLEVIHTPGHTRGGICLYYRDGGILFTGDTLFAGSVGRTDFEGGSYEELIKSIRTRILPLGDEVRIYPGHGPDSTIADEKQVNPFISGSAI